MTNTGPLPDYCTFWFDWIGDIYIGGCCKAHDYAYEYGLPRLEADLTLGECVYELGLPFVGFFMALATTALGSFFYNKRKK